MHLPDEFGRLRKIKNTIDPNNKYTGESLPILRVFERIEQLNRAPQKPVLILGATGAGKSEIAELIHQHSRRNKKPFMREQASDCRASDPALTRGRWTGYGKNAPLQNIPESKTTPGILEKCAGGHRLHR